MASLLSFLLILVSAAASDYDMPDFSKGGGFGGGGRASSCPAHKCSKGYEAAPSRSFKLVASGCSGIGGGMVMSMGADEGPLESCCSRRTACFQTCGSSKKQCEKQFETCNYETCKAIQDEKEREKCESSANLQQMLANMNADCGEFSSAQSAACQCLTPEKALARREKTLRDLYKKYNPDQMEKVDGLITKAGDDVKKFAALLTKFIAKFPQMIRIKKTEQQEMYENMFNDAKDGKSKETPSSFDDDNDVDGDDAKDDFQSHQGKANRKQSEDENSDAFADLDNVLKQEL